MSNHHEQNKDKDKETNHKVVRVQGGDDDLVAALNTASHDGWDLVKIIPVLMSTSATSDNAWAIVLKKG